MTNICQAIEEELTAIQIAVDQGIDIYDQKGRPSGSTSDLWRQILSNPETLRIEVSLDFVASARDLYDLYDCSKKPFLQVNDPAVEMMRNAPVIIYIPDFKGFNSVTLPFKRETLDGVFLTYWADKFSELQQFQGSKIGYTLVQPKLDPYTQHISPISVEDARVIMENEPNFSPKETTVERFRDELGDLHTGLISVLHIMNQPNFVTQTTVGSSGIRKRLEKKKGIPKERWSRIQWNVGQQAQREVRETMGEEHCTALHRVRGFYRTAKSHYNNVKKIDGKWFQWIEPFWRGHPAFGIVKSSHAPQMEKNNG